MTRERLLAALRAAALLCDQHDHRPWGKALGRAATSLAAASTAESAHDVTRLILSWYSGMGGINDVPLMRDGAVSPEQPRFAALLTAIWQDAVDLRTGGNLAPHHRAGGCA